MKTLKIKGEEDSPIIDFDAEKGSLKIIGRSIPEDTVEFYQPILDWLDDYLKNPAEKTTMDIQLDYCNSFSRKYLLEEVLLNLHLYYQRQSWHPKPRHLFQILLRWQVTTLV